MYGGNSGAGQKITRAGRRKAVPPPPAQRCFQFPANSGLKKRRRNEKISKNFAGKPSKNPSPRPIEGMKNCWIFLCLVLLSCAPEGEGPLVLEFPPLPGAWTELLGSPRWLVRYYAGGAYQETGGSSIPASATGPVLAWPCWPSLPPGSGGFRPAGLILPLDLQAPDRASGARRLALSWQGGVDAWFYQALDRAARNTAAGESPPRPGNFNWPRFRALFSDPSVPQEIRDDPWRADWDAIAERTVRSGFRKQWLKAVETTPLVVPAPPGPWVSGSPFAPALEFGAGPCVFPAEPGPGVQAWYSAAGILRYSQESWIFLPWG